MTYHPSLAAFSVPPQDLPLQLGPLALPDTTLHLAPQDPP